MTEGMMGRGSDTRIYAPRSESSHMFRANHEDESTPTGVDDAADKERRMDKRQKKKEAEEKEDRKMRHIKIRRHHMGHGRGEAPEIEAEEDDSFKPRASVSEPTIPAGAGGFLTSLATQAKGPGAAGGEMIQMSEPMDHAWSELLKSNRSREKRRKTEQRAKWRPSTGQFKRPPGGFRGKSYTSQRAKGLSRNLPVGKKTGLMRPHLAVEMAHRGIASKQPMSKDPQAYGQYRAYQEAQKIQGGVRAPKVPLPFGRRSPLMRLPKPRLHPVRAPPIMPPRLRRPRLNRPKMPGMVTMSEDKPESGDILKARRYSEIAELRMAVRQLKDLLRDEKDRKRKGMGAKDTSGGASDKPNDPGGPSRETNHNQGATESQDSEAIYGYSPSAKLTNRS